MNEIVLEAVQMSGQRAILLSGWAGLGEMNLPKSVLQSSLAHHQTPGSTNRKTESDEEQLQVNVIILANQSRYGIRIVLTTKNNNKIFEAFVEFERNSYKLLQWREIYSISDINSKIFSQYFKVETSEDDEEGKELLLNVFKG